MKKVTRNSVSGIHGSNMTWQLKFPKAHFQMGSSRIELELGKCVRCVVRRDEDKPNASPDASHTVAAIEIRPGDPAIPTDQEALDCEDAYVRQDDLVAYYPQTYPWPFGFQVDVRALETLTDTICGIELWLSIQTSLLESNPSLIVTPMSIGPHWKLDGVLVADTHQAAILIHPLDLADCNIISSQSTQTLERLVVFGGFMEKGVIRRARLRIAWSDKKVKNLEWQEALQSFSASPLPLTV